MGDTSGWNPKRRKIDHEGLQEHAKIHSAHQLENLLRARKESPLEVKSGIQTFKDFLTSINDEKAARHLDGLKILKDYCEGQRSPEKFSPSFPDLISTWNHAVETRNDALLSAVPAVLAQFLKLISQYLEFRDFGLSLCETLLWRDQIRLFERGLTAPTFKAYVISPCLRLLTEVVGFDGGTFVSEIFFRREVVFKRLDILLGEVSTDEANGEVDRSKPTIRRIAQRFVLANLTFQDAKVKSELILQGRILQSFLRGIEQDASDIVHDILQAIQRHILNDPKISTNLKIRFLNIGNLASLLNLYAYETVLNDESPAFNIRDEIHQLLLDACTQQSKGLLTPQSGWYPAGVNPEASSHGPVSDFDFIDLGLDSSEYFDDYQTSVPVKNGNLSTLIRVLSPEKDTLQAQLLLKIFERLPELVADYFTKKTRFQSPIRDEPEWRGEFAFLFSVVQLPVPPNCGWQSGLPAVPPPLSIVIESILPRPFTRAMLTKCVNLNQNILSMSAARVITLALQKLRDTLSLFNSAQANKNLWSQASIKLRDHLLQRCPLIKDIAVAAARVPKGNDVLQGAMNQCLSVFLELFPRQAGNVKFDMSKYLSGALRQLDSEELDEETKSDLGEQLPDLLTIAEYLTEVRWWQQVEGTSLSSVALLLKLITSNTFDASIQNRCTALVKRLLTEKGILHSKQSFDALFASLRNTKKWSPGLETFKFLDGCMNRIVQRSIRYLDALEAAQQLVSDKKPLSLIACCISEQWPFLAKSGDKPTLKNVAEWIARLFAAFDRVEENYRVTIHLQETMLQSTNEKPRLILHKALGKQQEKQIEVASTVEEINNLRQFDAHASEEDQTSSGIDLDSVFGVKLTLPTSITGLDRWDKASLDTAIPSGRLARLLQCTASAEEEIRRFTFQILQTLLQTFETSTHPAKSQLQLLLGELLETIKAHGFDSPIPSVVPELATLLARTVNDPADRMYGKANRFFLKAPSWNLDRILTYWMSKILLSEPEDDDGHLLEVDRLLQMLQNGVRTTEDVEFYRRAGVWERICALMMSPRCSQQARRRVLGIVWRAIQVKGGKSILVRRAGIVGWLQIVKTRVDGEDVCIVEALLREMVSIEDSDDVRRWRENLPILKPEIAAKMGA